jgi:hypothetical protein
MSTTTRAHTNGRIVTVSFVPVQVIVLPNVLVLLVAAGFGCSEPTHRPGPGPLFASLELRSVVALPSYFQIPCRATVADSSIKGEVTLLASCAREDLLGPCHEWGPVPRLASFSSLTPEILTSAVDAGQPSRRDLFRETHAASIEARAPGAGVVRMEAEDGRWSDVRVPVASPASWRTTWLLSDRGYQAFEVEDLPAALAFGGSIRVVTQLLLMNSDLLCGRPSGKLDLDVGESLGIEAEPGYGPGDPGGLVNGVVRVAPLAESAEAVARLSVQGVATVFSFAVVQASAIDELRIESVRDLDKAKLPAAGFAYLGFPLAWEGRGHDGVPGAFVVRLRAFAGAKEVGGARLSVENLTSDIGTLVDPHGVAHNPVETIEPIVGIVPRIAGRIVLRVKVVGSPLPPRDLSIDVNLPDRS